MTAPTLSLHRKLAQVMHEVGRIPKNGTAPQSMGGYKFVQVGDAADAIRKALADQMLTMVPVAIQVVGQVDRPTKSGGTMTTIDLIQTWRITDAESGESIEIQSFGAGADGGDKYSGKAMTSAMKYALLTGFLLSTGEDSELGTAEAGTAPAKGEAESFLGNLKDKKGTIRKGDGHGNQLEGREGPDGHVIGFKFEFAEKDPETGDKKNIAQVICPGPIGELIWTYTGGHPETLAGKKATVRGQLFNVIPPAPRQSFYRLIVQRIATDDWIIPADEQPAEDTGPEPPPDMALPFEEPAK